MSLNVKKLSMERACLALCCCLVLLPGCGGAEKRRAPEVASVRISPPVIIEHYAPQKQKKVHEFVRIDGEYYAVPYPWRGQKIKQASPDLARLKQIPVEYTKDQSKLFIEKEACEAFVAMAEAARREGINLVVHSGFRSVWYQRKIFSKLMAEGRTWEDLIRYVAPPGYSEHMLGLAVDLYPSNWRFASTPAYAWLQEKGPAFHFVESYPEFGKSGFPWEAWHWRYVGTADAGEKTPEPVSTDELKAQTLKPLSPAGPESPEPEPTPGQ